MVEKPNSETAYAGFLPIILASHTQTGKKAIDVTAWITRNSPSIFPPNFRTPEKKNIATAIFEARPVYIATFVPISINSGRFSSSQPICWRNGICSSPVGLRTWL